MLEFCFGREKKIKIKSDDIQKCFDCKCLKLFIGIMKTFFYRLLRQEIKRTMSEKRDFFLKSNAKKAMMRR